jgi:hypothetical protein
MDKMEKEEKGKREGGNTTEKKGYIYLERKGNGVYV